MDMFDLFLGVVYIALVAVNSILIRHFVPAYFHEHRHLAIVLSFPLSALVMVVFLFVFSRASDLWNERKPAK